jgi:hypothetical protein
VGIFQYTVEERISLVSVCANAECKCRGGYTAFLLNFYSYNPIETAAPAGQHLSTKVIPRNYTVNGARLYKIKKEERAEELKCL